MLKQQAKIHMLCWGSCVVTQQYNLGLDAEIGKALFFLVCQ